MTEGLVKVPQPKYEKWQIVDVYERPRGNTNEGTPQWWLQGQITCIRTLDGKIHYQIRRIVIDKDLLKGYEDYWEPNKWIPEELIKLIP